MTVLPINKTRWSEQAAIQRLMPRHFAMIEMHVAGYNNTEIAEALDVSRECVNVVLRSPLVIAEVNRSQSKKSESGLQEERDAVLGKVRSMLEEAAPRAVEVQTTLMESSIDDSVRLRASTNILDRIFPTDKGPAAVSAPIVNINIDVANLLITALKESRHDVTSTNGSSPNHPEGGHRDVCEASPSSECSRSGCSEVLGGGRELGGRNGHSDSSPDGELLTPLPTVLTTPNGTGESPQP